MKYMHLFYCPDIKDSQYQLSRDESKHCVRVLRLQGGDPIYITDGIGNLYHCEITIASPSAVHVRVLEHFSEHGKRNYHLHMAVAPTKNNDRFEWFLEKATELGIDEITPILCHHSERKVIKPERMERIIHSAVKQSLKAYVPQLNPMISFVEFIANDQNASCFIAHCNEGEKTLLKNTVDSHKKILILIGPEGDFSPEETQLAIDAGYTAISLGNSRLRTETAAIAACHTVQLINQ